jgi:hypothetical protein
MRRLKEAATLASLQEKSLAVAVLHIEGIADIAEIIAARVSEQVLNAAILRLSAFEGLGLDAGPAWQLGQLGENALALVIESDDRTAIEACVSQICERLILSHDSCRRRDTRCRCFFTAPAARSRPRGFRGSASHGGV